VKISFTAQHLFCQNAEGFMACLIPIYNKEAHRTVDVLCLEKELWFRVLDIAKLLGYKTANQITCRWKKGLRVFHNNQFSYVFLGARQAYFITKDSLLFFLETESTLPVQAAQMVHHWVTNTAVPYIESLGLVGASQEQTYKILVQHYRKHPARDGNIVAMLFGMYQTDPVALNQYLQNAPQDQLQLIHDAIEKYQKEAVCHG
jgi:prophage antirepressor-like protein